MKIEIRKASSKDLFAIQELLKEGDDLHASLLPMHFLSREETVPAKHLLEWMKSARGKQLFLVATAGSQVAGLLFAKATLYSGNLAIRKVKTMAIEIVAVKRSYRRLGIGLRLVQEIENYAKTNGFKRLILNVFEKNQGAVALYEKAKFERLAVKMEKHI